MNLKEVVSNFVMSRLHERFKVHKLSQYVAESDLDFETASAGVFNIWKTHVLTMLLETSRVNNALESANQFKC
jgi:hypothetical protein